MEITTATETVTINKYTIVLTEAELAEALVDPASLQKALRQARGEKAKGKHGRRNLTLGKRGRPVAATSPKATKRPGATSAFTKQPCGKCGRPIAQSQISNHLRRCKGAVAAASA